MQQALVIILKSDQAEALLQIAKAMLKKMAVSDYDMIIAVATPAAISAFSAVKSASSSIPVVFCAVSDPIEAGIVESLEAPGNNCTGTADAIDLKGQVALIKALQPEIEKLGVLYTTSEPNSISR